LNSPFSKGGQGGFGLAAIVLRCAAPSGRYCFALLQILWYAALSGHICQLWIPSLSIFQKGMESLSQHCQYKFYPYLSVK